MAWDRAGIRGSVIGVALLASYFVPPRVTGIAAKPIVSAAVALLVCGLALGIKRSSTSSDLRSPRTLVGFGWLAVAGLVSVPFAKVDSAARAALLLPVAMLAMHFAAGIALRTAAARVWCGIAIVLGATAVSGIGLARFRDYLADVVAGTTTGSARAAYLSTPFFEHGYLAVQAVAPLTALAVGLALACRSLAVRATLLVAATIHTAFVAASASRAAVGAVAVGVTIALLSHHRHRAALRAVDPVTRPSASRRPVIAGVMFALLALGVACSLAPADLVNRFRSLLDPDFAAFNFMRAAIWTDTLRLAADHLPWGIGAGNFGFVLGEYHHAARPLAHAHNQFLHTLAETGVTGVVGLMIVVFACTARSAHAGGAAGEVGCRAAWLGALGTMLALSLVESPLAFSAGAVAFATFTGALAATEPDAVKPHSKWATSTCLAVTLVAASVAVPAVVAESRAARLATRARDALAAGDLATAGRQVAEAEAIAPGLPEVVTLRARIESRRGERAAAIAAYRRHAAIVPGLPDHELELAALELADDTPDRAISSLLRALRRAPAESIDDVLVDLCTALQRAHRYEAARLKALDAIAAGFHNAHPVLLLRLAESLLNLHRDRAVAANALQRYLDAVSETEGRYARSLLDSLDDWYR